jgi:hypothetical protein
VPRPRSADLTARWDARDRPVARTLRRAALWLGGLVVLTAGLDTALRDGSQAFAERRRQSEADVRLASAPARLVPVLIHRDVTSDEHGNPYATGYHMAGVHTHCQPGAILDVDPISPQWCSSNVLDMERLADDLPRCASEIRKRKEEVACSQGVVLLRQDARDVSFGRYSGASPGRSLVMQLVHKNLLAGVLAIGVAMFCFIASWGALLSVYGGLESDLE